MATGYEDIEKLTKQQNDMLDESLQKQNKITNQQTEMNVAQLERNKQDIDTEANKTNRNLYTDYKKASSPYGANAENIYSQGLGNSGYAESSKVNMYNQYQKNVTDTINNAQKLKSDFDFQISQARQTGNITLAENALAIYNQKLNLLTQEYELKNNREQFLYQKSQDKQQQSNWEKQYKYQQSRDKVSDSQWKQNFDYQQSRNKVSDSQWKQSFDYQKSRDKVSDSQWQKQYELSKKASASSSRSRSGSSSKSKKSSGTNTVSVKSAASSRPTAKQVLGNIQVLSGPGTPGVIDGISGKKFSSTEKLLEYYGYATAK